MPAVSLRVALLSYTRSSEEVVAMGGKLCYSKSTIAEIQQGIQKKDQSGYLQKLVDMGHLSPVEHANFTFGIEGVSRALLAQVTRHRIASFSVQSQRYVGAYREEGTFNYIVPPSIQAMGQDAVNTFENQMVQMQNWYNEWAQKMGQEGEKSNEDARFVLPNAAETKIIMTMNARELLHFFNLRCCNRAQWEIRAMAEEMLKLLLPIAPNLFKEAGPPCLAGPCPEGKMCCGETKQVKEKYKELQAKSLQV